MSEHMEREFETRRLAWFAANGAPVSPRRVADSRGRMLYALETDGPGEPVVVVHGGGSEAGAWAPLAGLLPKERRWLFVDRPGHGLSYKLDYSGLDFRREAVVTMRDLLDGLGVERATLVGNSMGGYFSLCFALAHPERVEQLVLLGAPAGVDRWIPPFLRLMGLRWLNRPLFAMMRNPSPAVLREKLWRSILVADPTRVSDEMLEVGIAAAALPGAELAWRTLLESVLGPGGFAHRYLIREEVARLAVPTRFVWGDRDAFAPPTSGADLAARMPDATLEVVAGAGHVPWVDAPPACAAAIARALAVRATGPDASASTA